MVQRGYSCAIKHVYGLYDENSAYKYQKATTKQEIADAIAYYKDGFNLTAITCQEPTVEGYLAELGFERIAEMPKCSMYDNGPSRKPLTLWLRKCPLPMWGEKLPEPAIPKTEERVKAEAYAIYDNWGDIRPGESKEAFSERVAREQEERARNYKPIANYHDNVRW